MRDLLAPLAVERMCALLDVSRAGYYKFLGRGPSARDLRHDALLREIRRIFLKSRCTYGVRRMHKEIVGTGFPCNRKTVATLMHQSGIAPIRRRKFKSTTDSRHHLPVSKNLLNREFSGGELHQVWMSDITYVETKQGWLYLAVFIDRYSRQVVGWRADKEMTAELVLKAFEEAQVRTGTSPDLVHSDRGSQYASEAFRAKLNQAGCQQSMSRKGNCWDNAVAESFFGTIKSEMIYHATFDTREQAQLAIFDYIETFYNTNRLHSALKYQTPVEFALKGKKVA